MKKISIIKPALLIILFLIFCITAHAQQLKAIDGLGSQMDLYAKKIQSPVLFVHFDKNVYSNNEAVWFTAYLLNAADYRPYKTLSVALIKDDSRTVMMEDRFVTKNGMAFGNAVVPDSVGPGNYTFVATTDVLVSGKPEVVFTQPITIKTADDDAQYTAELNPVDTSAKASSKKVMLRVNFNEPIQNAQGKLPLPFATISYYVGAVAHPVLTGSGKTEDNKYLFAIPSGLLSPGNNWLHVQLKYKKDIKEVSIALPVPPKPAVVRFYPEGGNLVNNIQSIVGWEAKSAAGNPIGVSAFLYENNKLIDTIETNSYGLGRFNLIPKAGSDYAVKLYNSKQDTLYKLPAALTQGPALFLTNAVVDDTLTVTVKDNQQEKLYLTGHNYKQLFFTQPVNMIAGIKRFKLVISTLPKGLAELTLTDSLGRPFAERLFFAHYNQREPLIITTDKNDYAQRQKVNVKIKLDTPLPDSGFVSIACVQENRISLNKANDIESYFYLKNDLGSLPVRDSYLPNSETNKQFLENILLIKGWSRYTWTDILKAQPADTMRIVETPVFKGNVTQTWDKDVNKLKYKPLDKPTSVLNMQHPLNPVITDATGAFTLKYTDLLAKSDEMITLYLVDSHLNEHRISVTDPYKEINEQFAQQLTPRDYNMAGQEGSRYLQIPDNERAIHLKEVKITSRNDNTFVGLHGVGPYGRNECGDYVCRFGVLNCTYHRYESDNHPPVIGREYFKAGTGIRRTYTGCTIKLDKHTNAFQLKGIYEAQELYPLDEAAINNQEPQYLSTLYWKHLVKVSSLKEAAFSFYTGDISGRFKIVAQGITGKDVTYGDAVFNVTKPK